jgi:hypothetical protein
MNSPALLKLLTALLLFVLPAVAEDKLPRVAETFEIEGNKAFLYPAPEPAKGRPWVWFAPTLHLTERSEEDAYRHMVAALDYGCVSHWYRDVQVIPTYETITKFMYPITPVELHEGFIIGRERILTTAAACSVGATPRSTRSTSSTTPAAKCRTSRLPPSRATAQPSPNCASAKAGARRF